MSQDYYEILGIQKGASSDEIKKAYRKLALKHHPDRNQGNPKSEETFKKISEAYAVLSDPEKKKQYDMFGSQGFHQKYSTEDIFRGADFSSIFSEFGGAGGFDSIFSQFFGGGRAGQRQGGRPPRGQDVETSLDIGFMEAYQGGERAVNLRLSSGESRELKVRIPAGAKDGARLKVPGRGADSPHGGPTGDLYLVLRVLPHPVFSRVDDNIDVRLPLKVSEALLGTSKTVQTPEGDKTLKVPHGVKPGVKIRLKGLGFSNPTTGIKGDLFAVVEFDLPSSLSVDQKEAVMSLQAAGL